MAGSPLQLRVHAKDKSGTLKCIGGDLFAVAAVAPDGTPLAGRMDDHQNGIYTAHLTCTQVWDSELRRWQREDAMPYPPPPFAVAAERGRTHPQLGCNNILTRLCGLRSGGGS